MSETENSSESVSSAPWLKPYHFRPGESGNPGGRPRKRPITEIYERMVAEHKTEKEIEAAMRRAIRSKAGNQSVAALKEIADRIEGRPTERIEHSGPDGEPLTVKVEIVKRSTT
jgi:hypothetical protein